MDNIINDYIRKRAQKGILLVRLINGIILLSFTLIYSYFSNSALWYLVYIGVIFVILFLCENFYKLYLISDNWQRKFKILDIFKINKKYSDKVYLKNMEWVEKNVCPLSKEKYDIFYNYIKDTRDIINRFDNNGIIKFDLLKNAFNSVLGLFLGLAVFYGIIIKIYKNYRNLLNSSIVKQELLVYINCMKYKSIK